MREAGLVIAASLLLVFPAAAAGDVLQHYGGPARLGADNQVGPAWPDVALEWTLPGTAAGFPHPLVIGDNV